MIQKVFESHELSSLTNLFRMVLENNVIKRPTTNISTFSRIRQATTGLPSSIEKFPFSLWQITIKSVEGKIFVVFHFTTFPKVNLHQIQLFRLQSYSVPTNYSGPVVTSISSIHLWYAQVELPLEWVFATTYLELRKLSQLITLRKNCMWQQSLKHFWTQS